VRGLGVAPVFTVGFCMGGRQSWLAAASGHGLAGADRNITAEDNASFDRALTEAGIEHEVVTYDGAPHSFFDRKQSEYAEASDDAWHRTLAFVEAHA
jgi:carboxymethylenebutenolidase